MLGRKSNANSVSLHGSNVLAQFFSSLLLFFIFQKMKLSIKGEKKKIICLGHLIENLASSSNLKFFFI